MHDTHICTLRKNDKKSALENFASDSQSAVGFYAEFVCFVHTKIQFYFEFMRKINPLAHNFFSCIFRALQNNVNLFLFL